MNNERHTQHHKATGIRFSYNELLHSRQRLDTQMRNSNNWRRVSNLQGMLLEGNGGAVVGLEEEKPSLIER